MNKALRFFIGCICVVAMPAMAAVSIKKAAPVATQQASKLDGAGSLVGTALTLVSGVKALNQKVNALSAECQPTSAEISFVNETVKYDFVANTGEYNRKAKNIRLIGNVKIYISNGDKIFTDEMVIKL